MDMCFRMRPGLTSVRVIDYNYVCSVSAEIEVVLPEESGVLQIEVQNLMTLMILKLPRQLQNLMFRVQHNSLGT
jgi:hypothetical protein